MKGHFHLDVGDPDFLNETKVIDKKSAFLILDAVLIHCGGLHSSISPTFVIEQMCELYYSTFFLRKEYNDYVAVYNSCGTYRGMYNNGCVIGKLLMKLLNDGVVYQFNGRQLSAEFDLEEKMNCVLDLQRL